MGVSIIGIGSQRHEEATYSPTLQERCLQPLEPTLTRFYLLYNNFSSKNKEQL